MASQALRGHYSYDEKRTRPHVELDSGHHIVIGPANMKNVRAIGSLRLVPRFKKIAETNV